MWALHIANESAPLRRAISLTISPNKPRHGTNWHGYCFGGTTMRYHFTRKSANAKTGPIPVTTTAAESCPPSCPLTTSCYAKQGKLSLHWNKVTAGERGGTLDDLCASIAALPDGQLWRHNQAGDLPGTGDHVDAIALAQLVRANTGRRGFTYTHKPMSGENAAAVASANASGFTINLSANDLAHADELAALAIGPVVTLLAPDVTANTVTPSGRAVIVCPATQRDDVTCASCQMCQRATRSTVIGFPAHGPRRNVVAKEVTFWR
jgi:hypothetical protein